MLKYLLLPLLLLSSSAYAKDNPGQNLYTSRCAMCHGTDARATGPLAKSSNPPTPDLTSPAFRQRLALYPGVIVASIVLRPNGDLIPSTLKKNGVTLPGHVWTDRDLRAIDRYIKALIDSNSVRPPKAAPGPG